MAEAVNKAVADGDFANANDAILAALRDWKESREQFGLDSGNLGALWDIGIASGKGKFQSADEIIAEAKRRSG